MDENNQRENNYTNSALRGMERGEGNEAENFKTQSKTKSNFVNARITSAKKSLLFALLWFLIYVGCVYYSMLCYAVGCMLRCIQCSHIGASNKSIYMYIVESSNRIKRRVVVRHWMMNLYWCHGVMFQHTRLSWISYSLLNATHIAHRISHVCNGKSSNKTDRSCKRRHKIYTRQTTLHMRIKINTRRRNTWKNFENKRDTNEWRMLAWIHFRTKRQREKSPTRYIQRKSTHWQIANEN